MDWLRQRVWPMEAAHSPESLRAAARLATTELLASGTTAVLTMETVHDTDVVFEAVAESGLRATIGKCMMDGSAQVPARLREDTRASIDESVAIRKRWDGASNGRLRAAFAPRFAVSCSRELLEAVAALSLADGVLVHTHASESREEIAIVKGLSGGLNNVEYLASLQSGVAAAVRRALRLGGRRRAAPARRARRQGDALPGIQPEARDPAWRRCPKCWRGASRSRSARTARPATTGSTCSRRCGSPRFFRRRAGIPGILAARDVLWMATRNGARTLGLGADIGSIEPGNAPT